MREEKDNAVRPQTDDDYWQAAFEMKRHGGSFNQYIASAYFVADSGNRARLRAAFPDLFTRYYNLYLNTTKE